ncbi:hypothetical protein VIBNIMADA3020_1060041 [Vibrio nigripulchritudo MADA3020]|nr:hypothetical protein VIBNIMADA3020_1060041 [Vibrio nigripulchritudo MADA3020]CCN53374.1 hypothetical protein VIBNIMADA3021_30010 [Vibrio nigripulchritudo MADA3021]
MFIFYYESGSLSSDYFKLLNIFRHYLFSGHRYIPQIANS